MENNLMKIIYLSNIPEGEYELVKLQQDRNGLQLVFESYVNNVEIIYQEELLALRSCDEGDRWKFVDSILMDKGRYYFKNKLAFIIEEDSEFKQWFIQESYQTRRENEFQHYMFVTRNDIIDVLALHEPVIKISDLDS